MEPPLDPPLQLATLVQHKKILNFKFPSVLNFKNAGTVLTAKANFAQTSAKNCLATLVH